MKRFTPSVVLLFLIVFSPASFAAVASTATSTAERKSFELQELQKALAEAKSARSEAVLDERVSQLAATVAASDHSVSAQEALDEIIELVDGEEWVDTGWHRYGILDSVLRSQGLAIDEKGTVWYSGEWDVLRAKSLTGGDAKLHIEPIPGELSKLGDNHVGDIDCSEGKLYLPIEDGPKYNNPHIGVYDAQTLKFEKAFTLPHEQQIDGVPWVAYDRDKKVLYSSTFNNPTSINVYDATTGKVLPQIQMSRGAPHAQGAKVIHGMMYITTDAGAPAPKGVIKVNLTTGTAMLVSTFTAEMAELEGLAISNGPGGMALNVLGIGYSHQSHTTLNKRSELHVLKIKNSSLRNQLRQSLGTF